MDKESLRNPCGAVEAGLEISHRDRQIENRRRRIPPGETETAGQVAPSEITGPGGRPLGQGRNLDARAPSGHSSRRRRTPFGEVAPVGTGCGCRADRRTDDHIVGATRRPADDDAGVVKDREVARSRPARGGSPVRSPSGVTAIGDAPGGRDVAAPSARRRSRSAGDEGLRSRKGPSDAYSEGPFSRVRGSSGGPALAAGVRHRLQQDRHGSVVDQLDRHVRAEHPGRHLEPASAQRRPTTASTSGCATGPGAAAFQVGRRPLRVSA